jgi:hypothetical protein
MEAATSAKLDAALVARFTGDIPQNVNFALKAEVARNAALNVATGPS